MTKSYQVKVEGFEGPLDLLLHLINRYEIDIYDIPVAEITTQYMQFIHTMQELELDIASEYLVMAASLLAMKSQMLLPNPVVDEELEEELEEDPREELMRRLIEYRKYKQAAESLKKKEIDANRIYTRPVMSHEESKDGYPPVKPGEANVFDLIQAMSKLMVKREDRPAPNAKVQRDEIPIQTRMDEILDQVKSSRSGTPFFQLFQNRTRSQVVVTFMALLELMKSKDVVCIQQQHFDELVVYNMEDE
ncbi:segregation/condensation protein A [Halobacillus salinarum]|uniref:Segregation and condensation protein A n=1 Tax=Halobacillus salinarum TaxID=2932257 RepID=A0ABY4EES9_9BACI|nr:segregation/condensation protein A [Halobacillus salinarum]UOQ42661.1 segregation/condensation protein A [Halobacillus salinarum]